MDLIKYKNCVFAKNELVISNDITKQEWKDIGSGLTMINGSVQIWIGDWARFGEKKGFYTDTKTYEEIADITGYSKKSIQEFKYVADHVPSSIRMEDMTFGHLQQVASLTPDKQELFLNKAVEEKLSVRELRNEIKRDNNPFEVQLIPEGMFDLIYCDPPWKYDFAETDNRKIENQYPTMDINDICSMQLPNIADNALLLIWATSPKLKEAIKVIDSWGFEYKTHGIWDKQKIGMGYWFRGQHELLIVATKGNFSPPIPEHRESSIYSESRTNHSVKPNYYYEWIEKSFPNTNKIELFARNKRDGWEAWGNE